MLPLKAVKRTRLKLTPGRLAAVGGVFLIIVFVLYLWLIRSENISDLSLEPRVESEIRRLCSLLENKNSFLCQSLGVDHESLPYIFAITPTYARHVQKAELTRLCNSFLHVPRFHWIVVEDSYAKTPLVTNFLEHCGVPYAHLNVATQEKFKTSEAKNARLKPPRGVRQRNAGLAYLHDRFKSEKAPPGVVYFADDDNTYDRRLFDEMRTIKGIGVWPVALVGGLLVERPLVGRDGRVKGWNSLWEPERPFPVDMAGFAVNLELILKHPELEFRDDVRVGYLESIVLETLGIPYWDLEVKAKNATELAVTLTELRHYEEIKIEPIPEKVGLFIKHVEYDIKSKRQRGSVRRRYNDFLVLQEMLLAAYPYRLVPNLPPKRIINNVDVDFVEERRKGLKRWLEIVCRHPVLCHSDVLRFFLTFQGPEVQNAMKDQFRRTPDEFMISPIALQAKDMMPAESQTVFASTREQIKGICFSMKKFKKVLENLVMYSKNYASEITDLQRALQEVGAVSQTEPSAAHNNLTMWAYIKSGCRSLMKDLHSLGASSQHFSELAEEKVSDQVQILVDVLEGHVELCNRHEKNLLSDHQRAVQKMMEMKKRHFKGVVQGKAADQGVSRLEARILEQEGLLASMEARSYFSLFCINEETQLVHAYMELMSSTLQSLVLVEMQGHKDLSENWERLMPVVSALLPAIVKIPSVPVPQADPRVTTAQLHAVPEIQAQQQPPQLHQTSPALVAVGNPAPPVNPAPAPSAPASVTQPTAPPATK